MPSEDDDWSKILAEVLEQNSDLAAKNWATAKREERSCVLYAFTLPHFASVRIVPLDDFFWCSSPYTLVGYEGISLSRKV
jgi:hypothetical protein